MSLLHIQIISLPDSTQYDRSLQTYCMINIKNCKIKAVTVKKKSHHEMRLRQEEKPKFFNYLWMAHLYNHITWPVKHKVTSVHVGSTEII